jgi:hypothetical protein
VKHNRTQSELLIENHEKHLRAMARYFREMANSLRDVSILDFSQLPQDLRQMTPDKHIPEMQELLQRQMRALPGLLGAIATRQAEIKNRQRPSSNPSVS